jgi:hypothetical protein
MKVLVSLNREDYRVLSDQARREDRDVDQQAALILRRSLRAAPSVGPVAEPRHQEVADAGAG